jgi:DNA-binding HxlR family transcriptional regulator
MPHQTDAVEFCPIARTLDVVGDKWSLLIVREAAKGRSRFSEFQSVLGIAKDVLGARLARLVERGVLLRRPYRENGLRSRDEYVLTTAGWALLPILGALGTWGEQNRPIDGPSYLNFEDSETGEQLEVRFVTSDGRAVPVAQVAVRANDDFARA